MKTVRARVLVPAVLLALIVVVMLPRWSRDYQAQRNPHELHRRFEESMTARRWSDAQSHAQQLVRVAPGEAHSWLRLAQVSVHLDDHDTVRSSLEASANAGLDLVPALQTRTWNAYRSQPWFAAVVRRVERNDQDGVGAEDAVVALDGLRTLQGAAPRGLRYRLRLSERASREQPHRAVLWMHPAGASMNATVERTLAAWLAERGFSLVVFLRKDFEAWSDYDNERLLRTLPALQTIEGLRADRPVLLGFSSGGQGALLAWEQSAERFAGVIVVAAYPQRLVAATERTPLFAMVGTADSGVETWRWALPRYRARGANVEVFEAPGWGHAFVLEDPRAREALARWLARVATTQ